MTACRRTLAAAAEACGRITKSSTARARVREDERAHVRLFARLVDYKRREAAKKLATRQQQAPIALNRCRQRRDKLLPMSVVVASARHTVAKKFVALQIGCAQTTACVSRHASARMRNAFLNRPVEWRNEVDVFAPAERRRRR